MGRWILSRLLLAALTALLVWAFVVGVFGKFLSHPERFFGIKEPETSLSSEGEDVLFDDDSTVDWSDPVTDVFDSSDVSQAPSGGESKDPEPKPKYYEFILTPDYFDALLLRYSDGLPIYRISSSFSEGAIVLKGDASVDALSEQFGIPAAFRIFLPDTVPCTLWCTPRVEEGRMTVRVTKVSAGSDLLSPYLSRAEVLSSVEGFLNDQLTRYLPAEYRMQSVKVTETGMIVGFSAE